MPKLPNRLLKYRSIVASAASVGVEESCVGRDGQRGLRRRDRGHHAQQPKNRDVATDRFTGRERNYYERNGSVRGQLGRIKKLKEPCRSRVVGDVETVDETGGVAQHSTGSRAS